MARNQSGGGRGRSRFIVAEQGGERTPIRRAELEAAYRAVQNGGDVKAALGRIQNAGGGVLTLSNPQAIAGALAQTPNGVAIGDKDGNIIVDTTRLGVPNGRILAIDKAGNEYELKKVDVQVGKNGVESIKVGDSNFEIGRTKVDITENQRTQLLTANLPPSLRGVATDKDGNVNGWKIDPKAFPDPQMRAALYQRMDKSGVLRFPSDSQVAQNLRGELSKAGYGRVDVSRLNEIFKSSGVTYSAGDKGRLAAFGAGAKLLNEGQKPRY